MATFALSLLWGPSYSFPRICGQFGAAEPPTDREGTRHTAVPTVPSHFEKYPGKMIRPLLRPGLSLSLSLFLRLAPPPPPICSSLVSFYFLVSLSREPTVHLQFLSPSSPRSSPPLASAHQRIPMARRGGPFSFPETRCADVIVLSCFHAVSSRGKLAATVPAKRYGRVRHDSL